MNNIDINLNVKVKAEYMNNNIHTHIFDSLKKKYEGTCTEEKGYLINVNKINRIIEKSLTEDVELYFLCDCNADVLKPFKGENLKLKVTMIFIHGIFCQLNNLKLLIPHDKLNDYIFDTKKQIYIHKNNNKEIKLNDEINVKITDIRYKKKNYNCIGQII